MSKIANRRFGWPPTENQAGHEAWVQQNLAPKDILHIQLGLTAEEMGGSHAWVPTSEDLDAAFDYWTEIVPKGVIVAVTHLGEKATVVKL